MERSKLADMYSMSTLMIHDSVTELYEDLHETGEPVESPEKVTELVDTCLRKVRHELSLIKDMCLEYNDGGR